jgi:predicted enzyme related to lactoylglutathione lyase
MKLLLNIDVPDLTAARIFYAAAFGLTPTRRLGDAVVELLGDETVVYLLEKPSGGRGAANSRRRYQRHWTPLHCDWVVADLDTALQRALAAGAAQEGEIREAAWGRIVQLGDPFGHGWCLIQFSAAGYDAIASPA